MGMKKKLRKLINRYLGIDIVRYSTNPSTVCWNILKRDIDLVLDVGANVGQYAGFLFGAGYKGKIVSFEPLSQEHGQLLRKSAANSRWIVAERCAIGDTEGEIEMHVSSNSLSSSPLPMTDQLMQASPESVTIGKETVKLHRLSAIAAPYLENAKAPFLKIDVQGYEDRVLKGALEILPRMQGIEIELSFAPLYKDQMLFAEMISMIESMGFYLHDLKPFFEDKSGRVLQAEALFFKTNPMIGTGQEASYMKQDTNEGGL